MPQMSPLAWGVLFILLSMLLLIMSVKTYFMYFNQSNQPPMLDNRNLSYLIWMW